MKTGFFFEVQTIENVPALTRENIGKACGSALATMLNCHRVVGVTVHVSAGNVQLVDATALAELRKKVGVTADA